MPQTSPLLISTHSPGFQVFTSPSAVTSDTHTPVLKGFRKGAPGEDDQKPGEDDQKPGEDDQKPGEDDQKPGEDDQKPGEDDQKPDGDAQEPGGAGNDSGNGEDTGNRAVKTGDTVSAAEPASAIAMMLAGVLCGAAVIRKRREK